MVQHWKEQRGEEVRREGISEKERFWKTRLKWVNLILKTEIQRRVFNRKCKWNQMCLDACAGYWTGRDQGGIFPKIYNISKEAPPPGNSPEEGRLQHGFWAGLLRMVKIDERCSQGSWWPCPSLGRLYTPHLTSGALRGADDPAQVWEETLHPHLSKENKVTQRRIRVCPRVWGLCHAGRYYASWSS